MSIASLSIDFTAKIAEFEKDLKRIAAASEDSATRIGRAMSVAKGAVGAIAGAVTVDWLAGQVRSSAEYTDQIGKMAQKIGTTTEEFSALAYAASLADVSNETLAGGLKKLSTEIVSGGDKLAQLGIKTTDASGKLRSNADILGDVAERFATMEDGAVKTAIAVDIFGKSGAELIPLLNAGRQGLKDSADEAKRFGLIVGKEAVVAAEQFNDNLTRLAALSKGASVVMTGDLVKGLGEATKAFLEANAEGGKLAGIIAGINTLVFGSDRHINNKQLVEQTDQLLKLENRLLALREQGYGPDHPRTQETKKYLDDVREKLRITQQYRKVLDEEEAKNAPRPKSPAPAYTIKPEGEPKPTRVKADIDANAQALAQYVKKLEAANEKTQDLSETEKARTFLTTLGTTGEIAQVRELVLGLATRIDQEKELVDVLRLKRAAAAAAGDAVNRDNEWFAAAIAATPGARLEKQRADMLKLAEGFTAGVFGDPASDAAMASYGEAAQAMLGNVGEAAKETAGDFESLGATFSSAMEDAIVNGNDLRSVIQGLGDDILRITVRKTITEPIGNFLTDSLKGFSLGSLFGFAEGGIMTSRGPLPLRAYAAGGVASSPQLAMYGEGSTPEAFVPLPDGRSIPVTMKGGAAGGPAIVVNINNTIGDVASTATVVQGMQAVRAQIVGELARAQRFGGAMA